MRPASKTIDRSSEGNVRANGKGSRQGGQIPQPVRSIQVSKTARPLTLTDLPEEEKNKVARIVERLMSVVEEKNALQSENVRLTGELDLVNAVVQGHAEKLVQMEELNMSQQTGRATAIGLLHLYQSKLVQLASEAKSYATENQESRERCESMSADLKRLEALVDSQAASLCRGDGGTAEALAALQAELISCRNDLEASREELADKVALCARLERDGAEREGRVRELERLMAETMLQKDGARGAHENEGISESESALNSSFLNHSLEHEVAAGGEVGGDVGDKGDIVAKSSGVKCSAEGDDATGDVLEKDGRFDDARRLLASLSPKGSPQRRNVSTSPLPREVLAAHIGVLKESLRSGEWPDSQALTMMSTSSEFRRGGSTRPALTRPGAGEFGQEISPPRIPIIARDSKLLSGTASSSARVVEAEEAHARAMQATMPWSEREPAVTGLPTPPRISKSRAVSGAGKHKKATRKKMGGRAKGSAATSTSDADGEEVVVGRRTSRLADRRSRAARDADKPPSSARRAPAAISKRAMTTVRVSSESLLSAPSSLRPPSIPSAVSPQRVQAARSTRSTFSSQARSKSSAFTMDNMPHARGVDIIRTSHDNMYDASLFNLVDALN